MPNKTRCEQRSGGLTITLVFSHPVSWVSDSCFLRRMAQRWNGESVLFSVLHIPVVALTAWMSALWEERASKVGIATYLIKPVSLQMLKETIEKYTHGSLTRGEV